MRQHLIFFMAAATLMFVVVGLAPHDVTGAPASQTSAIKKEILGQGVSAVIPDRTLLLQRRSFAPGSDSGAHPAAGPTVLYVESGTVEFAVDEGTALLTREGTTSSDPVATGDEVDLGPGDAVFYDEGVVHVVANTYDDPAVTLEARLNPVEENTATPIP